MADESYRTDDEQELSCIYGRLLQNCADMVSADTRESYGTALAECLESLRILGAIKGLEPEDISGNLFPTTHPQTTLPCPPTDAAAQAPSILITDDTDRDLLSVLRQELKSSKKASLISAFVGRGMLNLLLDPFASFVDRGGKLRLLTSVMNDFNNPEDLLHLQSVVPGLDVRIYYPFNDDGTQDFKTPPPPFHVKCYLFEKPDGVHSMIIGSSNLTESGLSANCEWNYHSRLEINALFSGRQTAFERGASAFEKYWLYESTDLNIDFLTEYRQRWQRAESFRKQIVTVEKSKNTERLRPRPGQTEALNNLRWKRALGVTKTAVIAATGMGKTYLAAFDFSQSKMANVLFVAHRETIISKAADSFRKVLGDDTFGHTLTGGTAPAEFVQMLSDGSSVFAMVPSMVTGSKYMQFSARHFDYIVIDEFHHSAADSYQKLLDWFEPKFLLGLTATPERMDGRDVLANCDYDIAYEIRLFDAIEKQWLVPFQYFAIYDSTDYRSIRWTGFGYDEAELDKALNDDTRARLIINNIKKFLPSAGKIKALAFCSSRSHARYMNREFNNAGIQSSCLLGDDPDDERKQAINDLQNESHPLQVICSVDIFGEGVDIPAVSHVLLLRPTLSFTIFVQQIGRGLRLAPDKAFLVCLDFVGNFRNSYVAPMFFQGANSLEEYKASVNIRDRFKPPNSCHVNADTSVQRIWDEEIRRVLKPANRKEALAFIYREMRSELAHSPDIMDFFANPTAHDPYGFIREFNGWLRAKNYFEDLTPYEASLLDTEGEAFLLHIEKDLHPTRSYKMVVLSCLLNTANESCEWSVQEIAHEFKKYYLKNPGHLHDFAEMAGHSDPADYPISKVARKLLEMPLKFMSNKEGDFFTLKKEKLLFSLRQPVRQFWRHSEYRTLLLDRVTFGIKRYFYRNANRWAGL